MITSDKKHGYGYLIDWIILLGDLIVINIFFFFVAFLFRNYPLISNLHHKEKIIAFLVINLCYFFVTSFIKQNISSNAVRLDSIVRKSIILVSIYYILITASFSVLNVISIPIIPWLIGYILLTCLIIIWHVVFRVFLKKYRRKGYNFRKVIIIGGGVNGREIYKSLQNSDFGYRIVGFFDDNFDKKDAMPNYLGSIEDIPKYIEENDVDDLFCTIPGKEEDKIVNLITLCENKMIRFHWIPEYYKYIRRSFRLSFIDSTPVLDLRHEPLQQFSNRFLKRGFDIVFSVLILTTIFPIVYIIFGTIIKLTSRGPVFFTQKRTGIKGMEFDCYKFRSMRPNDEADKTQAKEKDPRVTKVGAFMRKTSIDEFPQFINVLKGEMSVVGPRPHMLQHTEIYGSLIDRFMVRHLVKPGITGWAQVTGFRGETKTLEEMEGRVKKDVWYLENWSFLLDIKIIFATIFNVFKGEENAY